MTDFGVALELFLKMNIYFSLHELSLVSFVFSSICQWLNLDFYQEGAPFFFFFQYKGVFIYL